ncbi:MAG TPA: M20/M25/M40 family metallo-hydrolase [Thermoplasmata archaeon]|nr:M20/M25/M40 family metallo-hydrolase [Thermoplasmata archaeon]
MASAPDLRSAAEAIGDEESLRLLTQLVAAAPTNLEDLAAGRWEKPHYLRTADVIVRAARAAGLATRIYDPVVAGDVPGDWHGANRPNVIVDLDVGAPETVLILAHYDVVPVPTEQLAHWKSPPHTLTLRANGRLYGRGAADDLGSGVVASILAMKRLALGATPAPRNVRLLACCDEETGGTGGIEAMIAHDEPLPPDDPARIVRAEVALIPDGSPETTAGSSGVAVLYAGFSGPVPLGAALEYGHALVGLHEVARTWKSIYRSPDWPDRHAPEPVITGRATVTKVEVSGVAADPARVLLRAVHTENEASNQIARAVSLALAGPPTAVAEVRAQLASLLPPPFRLESGGATAMSVPSGAELVQLIGESGHGGYPHRAHNPVPVALTILRAAIDRGWIDGSASGAASFVVDVRLPPEMELEDGLRPALEYVRSWCKVHAPNATIEAPPSRSKAGSAVPPDHPAAVKLERIMAGTLHAHGITGEYGGTDASALRPVRTPAGAPLPTLVFGAMDLESHIHEAEESVDPRKIAGVAATIERFVREP